MNTAQALKAMTDEGKFELLATSVLRKHNPEYATILHTGINAEGKTIPSPLDGFSLIPNSNPLHFLMVEHTTTDTDKKMLEKKWLHDYTTVKTVKQKSKRKTKLPSESDDGDLIKAGRKARWLRIDYSNAIFTVILTTNQRVSQELLDKVNKKADELGVSVDYWDQSRIADFLDTTAEGHYLRKRYLGIEAEMLSKSLLFELSRKSLSLYEKELLLVQPDALIFRENINQMKDKQNKQNSLKFLIGESGSGKTVSAYQIFNEHLDSGGVGLWFPAELTNSCVSIEEALDKVLRLLYPNLLPDAGRTAMQLIQNYFSWNNYLQFLIVVDDLNRVDAPDNILHKLLTWAKPQQSNSVSSQFSFSPIVFLCPVWPKIWGVKSTFLDKTSWVDSIFVEKWTSAEAITAIQLFAELANFNITEAEASIIAEDLSNDPILIGLYTEFMLHNKETVPQDVINEFIANRIKETASSKGAHRLETEYWQALSSLSQKMLINRKLFPTWSEVVVWLTDAPNELEALRDLIREERICRIGQISDQTFNFRHDRIQQSLLVESMVELLKSSERDTDILWEPYYAEIIGQALLLAPKTITF